MLLRMRLKVKRKNREALNAPNETKYKQAAGQKHSDQKQQRKHIDIPKKQKKSNV